jgi:hypothetical protein
MRLETRMWLRALAGIVVSGAVVLVLGITSEAGANAHLGAPSVAGAGTPRLDATVRPHSIAGSGYDLVGSDGGVFVFPTGNPLVGGFFGSLPQLGVTVKDVVGITPTDNDGGYDLVGSDGGVFVFPVGQSSGFYGSLPGLGTQVNDIVGIVPTNSSTGYDLVGSDGGVFVFPVGQSGGFFGSLPQQNIHVNNVVGIAATPDDQGYWLVDADGIVYPFGDAQMLGDNCAYMAGSVTTYTCVYTWPGATFVGIASTPDGKGYWLVTSYGQVLNFGDAPSLGQLSGTANRIVSIVPTDDGKGYWLVAPDGGIFAFGDAAFIGSLPGLGISVHNVVGAVPTRWLQP